MEGGKEGEAVHFLASSVTVTKLPTVQYALPEKCGDTPEPDSGSPAGPGLVHRFEAFFFRLGRLTARRPVPVITAFLVFTGLGCAGLPFLQTENNAIKLWIPQNSDFSVNYAWLWNNFPPEIRQVRLE